MSVKMTTLKNIMCYIAPKLLQIWYVEPHLYRNLNSKFFLLNAQVQKRLLVKIGLGNGGKNIHLSLSCLAVWQL